MHYLFLELIFMAGFVDSHHPCLTWKLNGENLSLICRFQKHVQSVSFIDSKGKLQANCKFKNSDACRSFHIDGSITANTLKNEIVFMIKNYKVKRKIHEEWTCSQGGINLKTVVSSSSGIIFDTDLIMSGIVSSSLQSVTLTCFSCREPHGNNVEFLKDDKSVDSIRYNSVTTKCTHINGECRADSCSCTPSGNEFMRNFVFDDINTINKITKYSCSMMFADTEKSSRFSKITTVFLKDKEFIYNGSQTIITKPADNGQELNDGQTNVPDGRNINNRNVSRPNTEITGIVIKWIGIGFAFAMPFVLVVLVTLCCKPFKYFKKESLKKARCIRKKRSEFSGLEKCCQNENKALLDNRTEGQALRCRSILVLSNEAQPDFADIEASCMDQLANYDAKSRTISSSDKVKKGVNDLQSEKFENKIEVTADFALNQAKKQAKDLKSCQTEHIFNATKFDVNESNKTVTPLVLETKKTVTALICGKDEDTLNSAGDMLHGANIFASDGISEFKTVEVKRTASFPPNANTKEVKALKSVKTEDIFEAESFIAALQTHLQTQKLISKALQYRKFSIASLITQTITLNAFVTFIRGAFLALNKSKKKCLAEDNTKHGKNYAFLDSEEKVFQSVKSDKTFHIANDIATKGIYKFPNAEVKSKPYIVRRITTKGEKASMSGKSEDMFKIITDVAAYRNDKFADNDVASNTKYAQKRRSKALKFDNTEDIFEAASGIEGFEINKCADNEAKDKDKFSLNQTIQEKDLFLSRKTNQAKGLISNITTDKFADMEANCNDRFDHTTAKRSVKPWKLDNTEEICEISTDFAANNVLYNKRYSLNANERSLKPGKTEDMFEIATDIAAAGIHKFVFNEVESYATHVLNAPKRGVKYSTSSKTEDRFEITTDIADDTIDKFVDNEVVNNDLNEPERGLEPLTSGENEDTIEAAIDMSSDGIKTYVDDEMP